MPSIIIKFLTLVLSGALVFQQTTEQREPKTPAECLGAVRELPQKRYEAARAGGQKPDYAEIDKEKTELAKKYASQFSIETLGGKDLAALARLFVEAKEPELARKAVTRSLDIGPRGNGGRADALVTAIEILLAPPYAQESIDQAEAYMAGLDAMGSEFNSQKITGHIRLGGYYRYGDVDEKILLHERKVLALAARISSAERKTQGARRPPATRTSRRFSRAAERLPRRSQTSSRASRSWLMCRTRRAGSSLPRSDTRWLAKRPRLSKLLAGSTPKKGPEASSLPAQ
jgi:hypothetical protein